MRPPAPLSSWRFAAAGILSVALYLALILPSVPSGSVIGTGQDEWYNMIRGLRALYERFDPSYFIHPALYYELLAMLYGCERLGLAVVGGVGGSNFLDYFLAHEAQFLDLARYASVGCGALAVLAAVWLGTEMSGAGAGLLAGLLVASLPLLQTMATAIRVDALALAAFIGGTALVVRWYRAPDRRALVVAAGIGVAAAANYPGALLLLLLGCLEWVRPGDRDLAQRMRHFAAVCAVAFAVFLVLNPYVLIDLASFVSWFRFQASVALFTHPHGQEPSATRYLALLRDQGLPAVLACLAGAAASLTPREPSGAVGLFALVYFAAFSALRSQYDRFVLPAIALLCIAGAAWIYTRLAGRIGPRVGAGFVTAAAPLLVWFAAARVPAPLPPAPAGADYRAEMFGWIAENVPPTATLVFESDTLPLFQTAYDPGAVGRPFPNALRQAFERVHPSLPKKVIKAQFIAAVYNYDPKLLEDGNVYFLGSSQNREYIAANRAALAEPAAFYDALDAAATVVHESGGFHERLILYAKRHE